MIGKCANSNNLTPIIERIYRNRISPDRACVEIDKLSILPKGRIVEFVARQVGCADYLPLLLIGATPVKLPPKFPRSITLPRRHGNTATVGTPVVRIRQEAV